MIEKSSINRISDWSKCTISGIWMKNLYFLDLWKSMFLRALRMGLFCRSGLKGLVMKYYLIDV